MGKEGYPLIRRRCLTAFALLLAVLLFCPASLAAPSVRVYIPDSALPLSLPQIPEVPLILQQEIEDGESACEIVFSAPVDSAFLVQGGKEEPMSLSEDGLTARSSSALTGRPGGFTVRLDTLTISYAPSGGVRSVELSEKADRFFTGQKDPVTTIRWDCTALRTDGEPYLIWRISSVTAEYREDSYIRKVLVRYQGDQTMSVIDYEITYSPAVGEYYLIRYGKADHVVSGEYTDGWVTLVNGSGRHFWDNTWYDAVTGRQSGKNGLLAFTGFDSPRVKTR